MTLTTPPAALLDAVRARKARRIGEEWRFQCPHPERHRHGDADPSARYHPEKAVWRCDVCDAGGGWMDLCRLLDVPLPTQATRPQVVAHYDYRSEAGEVLRRKLRWEPGFRGRSKSFSWNKPDGAGGWTQCRGDGNPKVLYGSERLPKAREDGQTVFVIEGEKDCDTAAALGLVALCNPEGASASGKWHPRYDEPLQGLDVVVIADKDTPGRAHARGVVQRLQGVASGVRYLELPSDHVKDLTDWVESERRNGKGHDAIRAQLLDLAESSHRGVPTEPVGETSENPPKSARGPEALLHQLQQADDLPAVEALLRNFAPYLPNLDRLERGLLREKVIAALKGKVSSPAALFDIAAKQDAAVEPSTTGRSILFQDPAPWPEPVDSTELLDDLTRLVLRFVALSPGAPEALALWVLHTYTFQQSPISPLLLISSPEKRCGKTTLLTVLTQLVHHPLPASNITPAALFRTIEAYGPTLLIDEADTFIHQSDELRGVLNSGHSRATAFVVRTVGDDHEPKQFSTWAPKAVALIGRPPSTLEDRSIAIAMRRKTPDESVERLRLDQLDGFLPYRSRIARWAADHRSKLAALDPKVPPSLRDRAADNWRPLLAIAELAGPTWLERAHRAAQTLTHQNDEADSSPGVLLLGDIRDILENRSTGVLSSNDLLADLNERDDRPWPEWKRGQSLSAVQMARLLKPFGIRPQQLRFGAVKVRGYAVDAFLEAFSRYLPPVETVHPVQTAPRADLRRFSTRYSPTGPGASKQHLSTSLFNDVPGVPGCDPVQTPEKPFDKEVIEL